MSSDDAVREALAHVLEGRTLEEPAMERAMDAILAGEVAPAQVAGLAIALRMRGETPSELAAAARAMRRAAVPVPGIEPGALLDTCGTGGDGVGTFNVSTTAALVVAACGVRVAKHGSRAVSSRSGSADVLEALGVRIDPGPDVVAAQLRELGIGFFFAPSFHGAMRHAAQVRRDLGVRTFFNLLGPLSNPARASHQVLGVYDPARVRSMAEVLGKLGVASAWVVHGHGGLDEISPSGPTRVARLDRGGVDEFEIAPGDFGFEPASLEGMLGGDAAANARCIEAVLDGEQGTARQATVMNAAAALVVAGLERKLPSARARVEDAIDSGAARRLLAAWVEWGR